MKGKLHALLPNARNAIYDLSISAPDASRISGLAISTVNRLRRERFGVRDRGRPVKRLEDYPGVDWSQPYEWLMEELNLSRATVARLKRLAGFRKTNRLTDEHKAAVDTSTLKTKELADQLGVTPWQINKYRRMTGRSKATGPTRKKPEDFPDTDWTASSRTLAATLGISWVVARRLKVEAMASIPVVHQAKLPGFDTVPLVPADFANVDWRQTTMVLAGQTRLPVAEIRRLKSLAARAR